MPNVAEYDSEESWMAACMPRMMGEGRDKEQSVAACMSMWREKKSIGGMSLDEAVKWFLGREQLKDDEIKIGMRNNAHDQGRMQQIHDLAVQNGAVCAPQPMDSGMMGIEKSVDVDELIFYGDAVKALPDGKVAGHLVLFTNADDRDLTKEYFTKDETDYGPADKSPVLYNHGLDVKLGKRRLGMGTLAKDDIGVWIEAQLNLRDEYEKAVYELAKAGKLGWSSGTASHLVEKVDGKITSWPLGLDASLTPTPAEPRTQAIPLKSLIPPTDGVAAGEKVTVNEPTKENADMEKEEFKAMLDENTKSLTSVIEEKAAAAANAAVEEFKKSLPEIKTPVNVQVIKDEADQPWKSIGEYFMAVKNAAYPEIGVDPRLKGLKVSRNELMMEGTKANGFNESIPSQGGFLVTPQYAPGLLEKVFDTGTILSLFPRDPVSGNSMTYNMVDETSRANGSRFGGVTGYWGAEAGTKTSSKGKFKQLELKLRKVYALCIATDENLEDASVLGSWISRVAPAELRFKVEDAIINGMGGWQPLGILQSPALKSSTRLDASKIQAVDIGQMWADRYAGANDYVWLASPSIFPQLIQLTIGDQPMYMAAGGIGNLPQARLLGRPLFETEYNPTLGTAGDLMLVSPSQYQMIEKGGGIQYASSIHVYFTTDESAFRFVYRVDGAPTWSSTLTGFDGGTTSPFVVLAATT